VTDKDTKTKDTKPPSGLSNASFRADETPVKPEPTPEPPPITVVKDEPPVALDNREPGTGKFMKAQPTSKSVNKPLDHDALVQARDDAQQAHAAAVQAQTLAEIDAESAMRDFSTRFTEHMTTAPRTMDEIEAAYKLAQDAFDIAEDKADARTAAQFDARKALSDYLDAYHAVLVDERKTADAEKEA
jgi:hypothetical protein